MLTEVIKLDGTETDFAKVKEAAAMVDAGRLVAFPTETVYGIACRVKSDSLTKLSHVKGRTPDKHYTLHIGQKGDVKKYVPTIGLRAQKLIKNVWPGPVTIVFELDEKDAVRQCKSIGMEVFEALYQDNTIGIRCPDNPTATMLLQATTNPVVAPSANITGKPPAINAEQVLAQLFGRIELVLDGGPCKYKKSSTVVKIGKIGWEIVRQGAYSRSELEALSQIRFLFVCTGNTCRSPMAEGIFRKYLAEKLQCDVDRLDKMGYKIISASVMNMSDRPASAEAVTVCAAKGIDITAHRSRNLSREIVEESDLIFVMERMHQKSVAALGSEAADKCMLLAENQESADPIGQSQEFFERCAELIEKAVRKRIGELVI
jgi:protein-tyrosine phosphatase